MDGFKEMAEVSPAVFAEICTPKYVIGEFADPNIMSLVLLNRTIGASLVVIFVKFHPSSDLFTNPRYSNGVFLITFITMLLKVKLHWTYLHP